jgi:hypothetical protein
MEYIEGKLNEARENLLYLNGQNDLLAYESHLRGKIKSYEDTLRVAKRKEIVLELKGNLSTEDFRKIANTASAVLGLDLNVEVAWLGEDEARFILKSN